MSYLFKEQIDGITYYKWRPDIVENNKIIEVNDIHSNSDYRQFLVKNTEEIIASNLTIDHAQCCFNPSMINQTNNISAYANIKSPIMFSDCNDGKCGMNGNECDLKQDYFNDYNVQKKMQVITFDPAE